MRLHLINPSNPLVSIVRLGRYKDVLAGVLRGWANARCRTPGAARCRCPDTVEVSAYFNYDNGTGRIRGITLQQNIEVGPVFAAWMKPFADLGVTQIVTRSTGGSDRGALDYSTCVHHSNMDVYDHLVPEDLIQSALITASFVYHTAMREEMLPRKPLPPPFTYPVRR